MAPPFFSICIAAYKAELYVDECLRSIAAQSCKDYEVIVVDDGSPTPLSINHEALDALESCVVIRTKNAGPYAARQTAFEASAGEVILCVDADDKLIDVNALAKLREQFNADADVVLFNATASEQTMSRLLDLSMLGRDGDVDSAFVWHLFTTSCSLNSLWCKAFRRSLYSTSEKKNRPRLLMAEDRLQSLEVMRQAASVRLLNEPLYFYRPNPKSTTNAGYTPAYFGQQCYVEEEVVCFMRERGMALDGWAAYFLAHISNVLLGIRYNASLGYAARLEAYAAVLAEPVVEEAVCFMDRIGLPVITRVRLELLRSGRFSALDASMLPWKIGSTFKHLPDCFRNEG